MSINTDDADLTALRARIERYRTQYNFTDRAFDRAEVEDLYKRDAEFTAFDIAPPLGGYIGWDAYAVGWYKVMNKYRRIVFTFRDDLRLFRRGAVAWMSVSADWSGTTAGNEVFHKEMRLTLVWVLDDGVWRITQEHGSTPVTTKLSGGEVI